MYLEDLTLNAQVTTDSVTIDKAEMLAFAKAYDPVPLHTDESYAKTTRFQQLLAPGVLSYLCVWAKYLEVDFFGEQTIAGKSTHIEWFQPVFAGDVLTGTAAITAITPRNPYNGVAELTIDVCNQNGVRVLQNVTETIVARRPAQEGKKL